MNRSKARTLKARAISQRVARALPTLLLFSPVWAATNPTCERYALHDVAPGMSHETVRQKMGGEGVNTLIRIPGAGETSGAEYSGPPIELYVEYDHRIDRRPAARAVLVQSSILLSPATVQDLVQRVGPPHAGADELGNGLRKGAAVWVDEACGVVMSAYRSRAAWWAAKGGTTLQVESLDFARKGRSPASSSLSAILARKNAPAVAFDDDSLAPTFSTMTPDDGSPSDVSDANRAPFTMSSTERPQTAPRLLVAPPSRRPEIILATAAPRTVPMMSAPSAPQSRWNWSRPVPEVPASPAHPSAPTSRPQRVKDAATTSLEAPAERITFVPPVYPKTSKWYGVTGHVTLAVVVRPDGTVANRPRVVAALPSGRGFEEAAVDAVRKWRFSPARRGGKAVESNLTIGVNFE